MTVPPKIKKMWGAICDEMRDHIVVAESCPECCSKRATVFCGGPRESRGRSLATTVSVCRDCRCLRRDEWLVRPLAARVEAKKLRQPLLARYGQNATSGEALYATSFGWVRVAWEHVTGGAASTYEFIEDMVSEATHWVGTEGDPLVLEYIAWLAQRSTTREIDL